MKFSKKIVTESLNHPNSGKKVFTEGKRQNVVLSEEQLDRLLSNLENTNQRSIETIVKECHQIIRESITSEGLELSIDDYSDDLIGEGFDTGGYNRGVAAGEGIENIINGIKKAYDMIKDSDTRKKLANSITKLGNFMTITADAIASGRDQRAMSNPDSLRDPLPYPELDEGHDKEIEEGKKKDHDGDGDIDSDDYLAARDKAIKKSMKEDSEGQETYNYADDEGADKKRLKYDHLSKSHRDALEDDMEYDEDHEDRGEKDTHFESEKDKERLIQEDIKKMKQIIKPIKKI